GGGPREAWWRGCCHGTGRIAGGCDRLALCRRARIAHSTCMSLSDLIYRPFETLVRPLDIPYAPLPDRGPLALLLHFAGMFRGVLFAMSLFIIAVEAINLGVIWGV